MSFVEIKSYQYQGLERKEISVQGIKTRGISQLSLSGNLSASLRDSRDKIKAVVAQLVHWGPVDKILLNLLPSDLSKFSPQLELPMALATLYLLWPESLNADQLQRLKSFHFSGSLSLSGEITDSEQEVGFRNISECWSFVLSGEIPHCEAKPIKNYFAHEETVANGRDYEKFWLKIAADVNLAVLLVGPPGIGKSHLARWALSCLPKPGEELRNQIDRIWTLAGQKNYPLIPFQNPHSRTHLSEFVGVARHDVPRPGIFSLSHGGLLVLDEFPELARDSREILRNILDERKVMKNTKAGFCTWPANFWLIMTANPCPCGFAKPGDLSRCRCQESSRQKYLARFSGPLLDRVGIKFFLTEESPILINLNFRKKNTGDVFSEFPVHQKLSPREEKLFKKLWKAFASEVEINAASTKFFGEFVEKQKNFTKETLVHVYN